MAPELTYILTLSNLLARAVPALENAAYAAVGGIRLRPPEGEPGLIWLLPEWLHRLIRKKDFLA